MKAIRIALSVYSFFKSRHYNVFQSVLFLAHAVFEFIYQILSTHTSQGYHLLSIYSTSLLHLPHPYLTTKP